MSVGPKAGQATCMVRSGPRCDIWMSGATAVRHLLAIRTSDVRRWPSFTDLPVARLLAPTMACICSVLFMLTALSL